MSSSSVAHLDLRVGDAGVALLPERPPRLAPVTRRLLIRNTVGPLLALLIVGSALTFATDNHRLTALGLSLIVPGGGLLYTASPILFIAFLVLFGLALVLWWGLSAVAAPWVVVAAGAIVAYVLGSGPRLFVERDTVWNWAIPVIFGLWALTIGTAVYRFERAYRAKLATVPGLNDYLRT